MIKSRPGDGSRGCLACASGGSYLGRTRTSRACEGPPPRIPIWALLNWTASRTLLFTPNMSTVTCTANRAVRTSRSLHSAGAYSDHNIPSSPIPLRRTMIRSLAYNHLINRWIRARWHRLLSFRRRNQSKGAITGPAGPSIRPYDAVRSAFTTGSRFVLRPAWHGRFRTGSLPLTGGNHVAVRLLHKVVSQWGKTVVAGASASGRESCFLPSCSTSALRCTHDICWLNPIHLQRITLFRSPTSTYSEAYVRKMSQLIRKILWV
jgi:hypothetical protein